MVDPLLASFGADIDGSDWLSKSSREAARKKLARLRVKIGHPDRWLDYGALEIARDDALGNAWRARSLALTRDLAKTRAKTDRDEWFELPQSLDGYSSHSLNEIAFTAGLLAPPVFDPAMDDAVNFGAIGGVIGHELTHNFDDEGRKYDENGNLRPWWAKEDVERYEERAQCLVDQYGGYRASEGTPIDGRLTLGENVADNGGLRLAYAAGQPSGGHACQHTYPRVRLRASNLMADPKGNPPMADIDFSDFASQDPKQFSQLVKSASNDQLAAAMSGEARGKVLGEIFTRMPALFRADRAGATNAVVHWSIDGATDGGTDTYELVIADGTCSLSATPQHEPKLALTLGAVDFLKVVSGNANPVMLFMTGKLKAKGDLGLAAKIGDLFDIPKG
jgi:hypothetical protein